MRTAIAMVIGAVLTALLFYVFRPATGAPSGEGSKDAKHTEVQTVQQHLKGQTTSPSKTSTIIATVRKPPASWSPFVSSSLILRDDITEMLDLDASQKKQLEIACVILLDDITMINGKIEVEHAKIQRGVNDKRAVGKAQELGIYFPANTAPWVPAETRFKQAVSKSIGEPKAETFIESATPLLAATTGNFGRYPRIAIIECYEKDEGYSYRYNVRTGPSAVLEVLNTDFSPGGLSLRELENLFTKFPSHGISEDFAQVPPQLSRLVELDQLAALK